MPENEKESINEERIRKIASLYYSRQDIQKAIFNFSMGRETIPRYFEGFGKRPDSFQYPSEIFELAKKGATSFHCSEELWDDPLKLSTGMNEKQLDELRKGWDLLIDIDSKYFDYSKIMAELVVKMLKFHGVKGIGIKYSGSKGFHIIVPWKAFPEEINETKTKDMFPRYPRIILKYISERIRPELIKKITGLSTSNEYVRDVRASSEVIPDMILVSPRHLFRAPYSLHEKTALASVVIGEDDLKDFHPRDADPMKVKIRNFLPECREGEASRLLVEALDWHKDSNPESEAEKEYKKTDYRPVKLEKISDEFFPPSIKKILRGLGDGRKRALFVLINLFRAIGMERDELEKRLYGWNAKNAVPLKDGYIKAQIMWSYRNKIVPPPNYDKDYYRGIGIIPTPEELKFKNPVNYVARKASAERNDFNARKSKRASKNSNDNE
jgi:DNA primase catalytic subunit